MINSLQNTTYRNNTVMQDTTKIFPDEDHISSSEIDFWSLTPSVRWPKSEELVYFLDILRVIIMPVILFGNGLTIVAIIRFKSLQTVTNIMVASLAFADFNIGLTASLDLAAHLTNDHNTWRTICRIKEIWEFYGICLNIGSMTCIAFERFLLITRFTLYNKYVTKQKAVAFIVGLYVYGMINFVVAFHIGR